MSEKNRAGYGSHTPPLLRSAVLTALRLLPFRKLPLTFFALIESKDVRQEQPRDFFEHLLRNFGFFRFAPV